MGEILEFESARLQLHLNMLRHLGVPDMFTWRVIGRPRDRYWDGELYAAPILVAIRRDGRACAVDLAAGRTPDSLDELRLLDAVLDAAVVRHHLARRGDPCSTISSWVVFDDGGRIEVDASVQSLETVRVRAGRAMRDHQLAATHTHQLFRFPELASLAGSGQLQPH